MKQEKLIKTLLYSGLLLLCACAPTQRSLLAEQAHCVPIGLEEVMDLCVLNINEGNPNYQTNTYYLIDEDGVYDVDGLGGGFRTYEMLVSPSKKYVVITEDGGEGHPYFTVFKLDDIRDGNKPRVIESIEAYPSGFYGLEWQEDKLLFSTETDLLASQEIRNETDWLYEFFYQLDAETGELIQVRESVLMSE